MKKKLILGLFILLISSSLYSIGINNDWNNESISDSSNILNPANLAYRNELSPSFYSYVHFDDYYGIDNVASYLQFPESRFGVTFFGKNLSLSLGIHNSLSDRKVFEEEGLVKYKGYSQYSVGIDWGYKFGNLALGMGINGGSQSLKPDYKLRSNALAFSDYIVESFFSRYQPISSSQFFNVGFGGRYEFSNRIALSLVSVNRFDINSSSISNLKLSKYFESLCLGLSDISSEYSLAGELNTLRIKVYADLLYIGDNENRETRIGSEFRFQLSKSFYASILLGYQEVQPALIDIFSIDLEKATSHYGLIFNWDNTKLMFKVAIPLEFYNNSNDLEDKIRATIKFSYGLK